MAWGCLGSQESREALTLSSCPQSCSCPWLCRSSCHPPPKRVRGRGGPERGGVVPGHTACWRRRGGGGQPSVLCTGVHARVPLAPTGTPCERYRLSHPRRCPPDFPGEGITPPLSGKSWVSGAHLPHPTDGGRRFLWPRCAGPAGRRSPGGFLRPPPPTAQALSCRCPPQSQPRAEQLRSALRPQPLSQLSLGWGWAAGEQLQGGVAG